MRQGQSERPGLAPHACPDCDGTHPWRECPDEEATPCPNIIEGWGGDPSEALAQHCGCTKVSRIGYCEACGAYRQEYDAEVLDADGRRAYP